MKNLSWLYYKGYYDQFPFWNNYKPDDEPTKKKILDFFNGQNEQFTSQKLSNFDQVILPNITNSKFSLITTYPGLLLGSGYSHGIGATGEFKIGFQLDFLTGLPIIPGSSVKGTLRSVFPIVEKTEVNGVFHYAYAGGRKSKEEKEKETVKAKWILALLKYIDDPDFLTMTIQPEELSDETTPQYFFKLISEIFEGVRNDEETDPKLKYYPISQRNIFFDAVPGKSLHSGELLFGDDSITPHPDPLKNPVPLLFLKVLPNVSYMFNFRLVDSHIEPVLEKNNLKNLFTKIILNTGIGAKTNVGYGQFQEAFEKESKPEHGQSSRNQITRTGFSAPPQKLNPPPTEVNPVQLKSEPANFIKKPKQGVSLEVKVVDPFKKRGYILLNGIQTPVVLVGKCPQEVGVYQGEFAEILKQKTSIRVASFKLL